MKRIISGLLLSGLIILTGCTDLTSATSQTKAQDIANKTISAMDTVKSYDLNTDLTQNYTVFQKTDPKTVTDIWEWNSQRKVDVTNQQQYLSMNIQETPNYQDYMFQQYLIGGYSYYSQNSPVVGGLTNPWTKTKIDELNIVMWPNIAQVNPLIELVKTSDEVSLIGTEQINGVDCNIIQLNPSAAAAADWILSQQVFPGPSLGWWIATSPERAKQIDVKAYQHGSVKLWIGEDNNLIYKAEISINLDVEPGNVVRSDTGLGGEGEPTDVGFDKILRDFSGEWEFSDYNQSIQIQLPQEVLNAQSAGN